MFRDVLTTASLTLLLLGTAACNTIEGVGEDIKSVGTMGKRVIE